MIQIDDTILSFDVFEKKFICDLEKCKGACCVAGDSGAPLDEEEIEELTRIYPEVHAFMRPEGIAAVAAQGTSITDSDGDRVTPLVNGEECAYVVFEKGITKCAIEKAYEAGLITFPKPVSCHLYPIRITKYPKFEALNYHEWEVCSAALDCGKAAGVPLYEFLKEPLIRKYGEVWYEKVKLASAEVHRFRKSKKRT